jgi:hypothetical protein
MKNRQELECQKMATAAGWTLFLMLLMAVVVFIGTGAWMVLLYR